MADWPGFTMPMTEHMSFDQAARIMCEGMGTQFDPNMRIAFLYCRKQLEAYYSAL